MFKDVKIESWSEDDVDFLVKNYKTMTYKAIGEEIGRTEGAVRRKVCRERKKAREENIGDQYE